MFYSKAVVLALLPLAVVNAVPQQKRDFGDVIGSAFGDVTSDVGSVFDQATSAAVSAVSAVSSIVQSAEVDATASSVFEDATKLLGTATSQAFATIVTSNGVPMVEVTSVGGPAVTLATAGGMTTSFAGHLLTVATAAPSSSSSSGASSMSSPAPSSSHSSAALRDYAPSMSKGTLLSACGVVGSIFMGAMVVF